MNASNLQKNLVTVALMTVEIVLRRIADGTTTNPSGEASACLPIVVTAVNEHAALVRVAEACEGVTRLLELLNVPGRNDPIESAVFKARAALLALDAMRQSSGGKPEGGL